MPLEDQADLCLWKPTVVSSDLEAAVQRARAESFRGVSVFTNRLIEAAGLLGEADSFKLLAVIGFPFGAADADVKRYEVEMAIDAGAQEIEYFLNPGLLKEGSEARMLRELRDAVEAADERPLIAVLPAALLDSQILGRACQLAAEAEAKGVGLWRSESPPAAVRQARAAVGSEMDVKVYLPASGLAGKTELRAAGASLVGVE